jgi:predicted PhzF superfamily epimerase YddE/YHI9
MPSIKCWQVDAFTDRPFGGNSAAVCFLEQEASDDWMQAVAAEMNLSGTAFIRPLNDGFRLRFFTPAIEVNLSGHTTLASAHALWTEGVTSRSESPQFDFVSRFFAPASGINEDPVTGSAHCCLGPLWGERLGKTEMTAFQASARGGVIRVRVAGDRVHLSGQAVTVMRGELLVHDQ